MDSRRKRSGHARLALAITAMLAAGTATRGATYTWSGGGADNLWQTAGNWDAVPVPATTADLVFAGTLRLSTENDFPANSSFHNMTFSAGAGYFTLAGNAVTVQWNGTTGGVVRNDSSSVQTVNLGLVLPATATRTITTSGGGGDLVIGGIISGATANVTKTGAGTLTLTGVNAFSGTLTISAGTVQLGDGTTDGTVYQTANLVNNGTLVFNNAADKSYPRVISGSGAVTKSSAGVETLTAANTFSGLTTINGGTLQLDFSASTPTVNIINNTANSSALVLAGGTLELKGKGGATNSQRFNGTTVGAGASALTLTQNTATSLTATLNALTHTTGGALNFTIVPATSGVIATTTGVNGAGLPGSTSYFGAWASYGVGAGARYLQLNPSGQIVAGPAATSVGAAFVSVTDPNTVYTFTSTSYTLAGNRTGYAILANNGTAATVTLGANTLTLNGLLAIAVGGTTFAGATGAGGLVIGAENELVVNAAAGGFTFSAPIANGGSAGSLTVVGAGQVVFGRANTYSGTTTLAGGDVVVSHDSTSLADSVFGPGPLRLNGGRVRATTGAARTVYNAVTLAANTTFFSGHATGYFDKNLTFAGNVTLTGGSRKLTVDTVAADNAGIYFQGVIGDGGNRYGLTKAGAGTLTLSGANTYGGGTTLQAGTLALNNAGSGGTSSAIGTGLLTLAGGTLDNTSAGAITLSSNNPQAWSADFTFAGTRDLNLGTGPVTLGPGNRTVTAAAGTLTAGGALSHVATFSKAGAGTLALAGGGSLSRFDINAGTVRVEGGTLTIGSYLTVNSSGTAGAYEQTGGTVTLPAAAHGAYVGNAGTPTSTFTVSGGSFTVSGTEGLRMSAGGASTITVSGAGSVTATNAGGAGLLFNKSAGTAVCNLGDGVTFSDGTSGTLTVNRVQRTDGTGTLNFNGGTLRASQDNPAFCDDAGIGAYVKEAGGILDNNGRTIAIGQALQHGGAAPTDGGLTFKGAGSTLLTGANTYTGPTKIQAGTLVLATTGALPNGGAVVLAGGTLDAGNVAHTAGTLDLDGSSALACGTGSSLVFADSSSVDWSGGTVAVTGSFGPAGYGISQVKFGSDANALTTAQLALITVNGVPAALDADGSLVMQPAPATMITVR